MSKKAVTRTILIKLTENGGVNISPLTDVSDNADNAIFSSIQTRHYEGFPADMPGNVKVFIAIADFLGVQIRQIGPSPIDEDGGMLN